MITEVTKQEEEILYSINRLNSPCNLTEIIKDVTLPDTSLPIVLNLILDLLEKNLITQVHIPSSVSQYQLSPEGETVIGDIQIKHVFELAYKTHRRDSIYD